MLSKRQNLGRFAPASCCLGVHVYASIRIAIVDPVTRRRGSTGLDLLEQPHIGQTMHIGILQWIIIGSDWRPETKQGIEGKIDRFRSGRVRVRDRVRFRSPI